MRVLAAVDKFRGTATAAQVAKAIADACWEAGHDCDEAPVSDGGEGWLEAFGGPTRTSTVTGPLGRPVDAPWRFVDGVAIIEMAQASGLLLAGGRSDNSPMDATTAGTGELINAALDVGARRIIVGLGGSATTDGGLGAIRAIKRLPRLARVDLLVACDVRTLFTDAAPVFGPQKGASPAQIRMLTGRLERLIQVYQTEFGIDVSQVEGSGAAGGLAGGLVAIGGRLVPGFDLLTDELGLVERCAQADLVITGEGFLDAQSFEGKVVGGMQTIAARLGVPIVAIAGDTDPAVGGRIAAHSLVETFGREEAMQRPTWCVEQVVPGILRSLGRATAP